MAARGYAASRHCHSQTHCLLEECSWADPLTGDSLSPTLAGLNKGLSIESVCVYMCGFVCVCACVCIVSVYRLMNEE